MKKEYNTPEFEVVEFETEYILSTSGSKSFDPDGLFDKNADNWFK